MAITGVLRAGLIQVRVLELEKSVDYYVNKVGLNEVCRTGDGRVCLKAFDEFDHHSVILRQADTPGLDFMGFKVQSDDYLTKMEKDTIAFGLPVEHIPANSDQPGVGRRISVKIPTGHRIDLYADIELAEDHPSLKNPNLWNVEPHGMRVTCFDHALLYGPNAKESVRWFTEVLGMSIAERVEMDNGENLCCWLTGNNRPHDVAILEYEQPGKLHHFSFNLQSWEEVRNAADIMVHYDIPIDMGPTRHGITRGQTIYFFDPSGNRNEVYAGGYTYFPDNPTRVWTMDQVGRGIFSFERELNDRFLGVVT